MMIQVGSGTSWQVVDEYTRTLPAVGGKMVVAIDAKDAELDLSQVRKVLARLYYIRSAIINLTDTKDMLGLSDVFGQGVGALLAEVTVGDQVGRTPCRPRTWVNSSLF
jgi:hypothetical protein